MNLSFKMQILLSKYLPFPPFWICLIGGLLFVNNILEYHILNNFNASLLYALILLNILAVFLLKYKKYELKISKEEWQEICTFLKRKFPQYNFDDDFYCTEVSDQNNNFKYTELFLKLGSDYRVVVEEFKISEFKSFHEILKIFK
ncbi:hypothetical protein N3Z16_09590 (plasmid) [Candidatus Megaera polyxenophila]|jgi:hypothetical protein|uniref:hypothetical protein n=1 Tax=Candidatus Megaera polyxenophila TaxID=988779 RepID=UPI00249EFED6|nr:hypothetical protein N3Z16_09590 [Candidatus Megaera polyxenophila]